MVAEGRLETWTEAGWTAVHTIFRHRVAKPMYRVTTDAGAVDVTEDHSLLRADGRACARRSAASVRPHFSTRGPGSLATPVLSACACDGSPPRGVRCGARC